MKTLHRRIAGSVIVMAAVIIFGFVARHYASLDWLIARETQLRQYVRTSPAEAWLTGFVVYVALALVPGITGKAIICGWLYGFWAAVFLVDLAMTVAALISFFLSRFLFRQMVESRLSAQLEYFRRKLETNGAFYLLMVRLVQAPFSFVNYGSGATSLVSTRTFWWTTQAGILPGTMVFVFAGSRLPTLSAVADQGITAVLDRQLLSALVAISTLPLIVRWLTVRIRRRRAALRRRSEQRVIDDERASRN